ncbi:TetR/AcrR family transcriptional regulator [Pseudooctadecabacter jejudonensis]|uniref:DNA-binding transcriptional repressor AcrR n=1 Tax=Pseudooctadecabacter jejudonensis TaxID=1391910 RepID=A0A1Y5RKY6_9RHOB|nr:TetR/AcrR family transcriptional regulator [Pseudooctadecabacter jejudonensis]SLN17121.1 DNA-binding transcriptional repressor AcrR [Pseudooctadecabacter jejudonensis]
MKDETSPILDAALEVFGRYGYKRATMGDIAKAAGLSRQSLYARFAGKDDVYAAGLVLYATRMTDALTAAWAGRTALSDQMNDLMTLGTVPSFEMLRAMPDAADILNAAETEAGQQAMTQVKALKVALFADLLAPYEAALAGHGQTPASLATFMETALHAMLITCTTRADLDAQFASLKASVLALTDQT